MEGVEIQARPSPNVPFGITELFRRQLDRELAEISKELKTLAQKAPMTEFVGQGLITLRHAVLLMELPNALPVLWQDSSMIGFAAGSGLHTFRHWLSRRIAPDNRWTIALVVRYVHLDA
jgi:hypothetical protein